MMTARRPLGFELALVVLVSALVLVPGIWRYSLVDPWETHYGEVAREMLENDDWIRTTWRGTMNGDPDDNEGFRSKPVFQFWLMATGLRAVGVEDGGYSGEMTDSVKIMIAIRLPFILCAIAGLTLMWWMLARLVSRRMAWLGLLVVGSTPMFAMISRNAIPDMPMVACTIGAIALFTMATEDGDPLRPLFHVPWRRRGTAIDARHVVLVLAVGFVLIQALYFTINLASSPDLAFRRGIQRGLMALLVTSPLTVGMIVGVAALNRKVWAVVRTPAYLAVAVLLIAGGVQRRSTGQLALGAILLLPVLASLYGIATQPLPGRRPGQSLRSHIVDNTLVPWERHVPERYLVRALCFLVLSRTSYMARLGRLLTVDAVLGLGVAYKAGLAIGIGAMLLVGVGVAIVVVLDPPDKSWDDCDHIAAKLLRLEPITSAGQAYMLGCYALLGTSILAKGPPGLTVVAGVMAFYVLLLGRWRALYDGAFEIKRGLIMMAVIAVPWHVAMFMKDGQRFVQEYIFTHILSRAGDGVDNSPGTFEYYTDIIGHGMWLWAALIPAALGVAFLRARADSREGRVRFIVALWAIVAVSVFCLVQTKFHHYILPAVPPLALLVAFLLDDLAAKRYRLHPLYAAVGVGIVLLLCRDLMHEPDRWIEMFVFRYDRPWPFAEPWGVDPSDGFLGLGIAAAVALPLLSTRFTRLGVAVVSFVGLAICVWALQYYMPHAGTHWGMREAMRTYYEQRTIYGHKIVYFSPRQLHDDWAEAPDRWTFETMIPDTLHHGQPMTITLEVRKENDQRVVEQTVSIHGEVSAIGDHTVTIRFTPEQRAQLAPLIERGAKAQDSPRPPLRLVDADRLIGWQLYWRGENFWSGGEVWGLVPEMKTQFNKTDNVEFNKYINDRSRAPLGRRYFVVTEAGRLQSLKPLLPTPRGQQTFEILDTTSNKFSMGSFTL